MDEICNISVCSLGGGAHEIVCEPESPFYSAEVRCSVDPMNFNENAIARVVSGLAKICVGADDTRRRYFLLESSFGDSIACAQRNVSLAGSVNFRDLGGYLTKNDRRVMWGKIFRSGHLSGLTSTSKSAYAQLGVKRVCDFRLLEEKANENAELPGAPDICTLGIMPGIKTPRYFHDLFSSAPSAKTVINAMHGMMECLVEDNISAYSEFFQFLLSTRKGSILLNCSAGKERTGLGSALLLECLGVPRETVLYDFMLSRAYFPANDEIDRVLAKYSVSNQNGEGVKIIMPLLETRESYLQAAFDCIDENYGSTKSFAQKCFGLTASDFNELINKFTVR